MMMMMMVNGNPIAFEVDIGAAVTIMSQEVYQKFFFKPQVATFDCVTEILHRKPSSSAW